MFLYIDMLTRVFAAYVVVSVTKQTPVQTLKNTIILNPNP